jgi:hypothetical protein
LIKKESMPVGLPKKLTLIRMYGSRLAFGFTVALAASGCKREQRDLRVAPPVAAALDEVRLLPNGISGGRPRSFSRSINPTKTTPISLVRASGFIHGLAARRVMALRAAASPAPYASASGPATGQFLAPGPANRRMQRDAQRPAAYCKWLLRMQGLVGDRNFWRR